MTKVLSPLNVKRWHEALLRHPDRLAYLTDERAISRDVVDRYRVGWNEAEGRYTFPVALSDDRGTFFVNVRRYKPGASSNKTLNTPGYGKGTRLNFLAELDRDSEDWVLIAGGETDALSAISAGFIAVCGTNGEGAVALPESLEALRGRRVALALDSDEPGRVAAERWAARLSSVAAEVRNVVLPVKDVNDFLVQGHTAEELRHLIDKTPAVGARRDPVELLSKALRKVDDGESRNGAGFWLACQMRDEGYTEEEAWNLALSEYQQAVAHLKDEVYSENEARQSLGSAYSSPPRSKVGKASHFYMLTETGNAERLVARHGVDMRWVAAFRKWFVWDSTRWVEDTHGQVERWAKETVRSIARDAHALPEDERKAALKHATKSESAAQRAAMVRLAQSEEGVAVVPADFDTDPLVLNCRNGVLDLRTGTLRSHRREDYCRRLAPVAYDPKAKAPTFEKFLRRVQPDADVRAFLQRAVGYSLTGRTDEQKLLLLHGYGANGKSTLVELLHDLLGDYATTLPREALAARSGDRATNDLARLDGARYATVMEFEDSAHLNEHVVKQLTGGDRVSARFLYGEWFDFRPQATLWVSTNHRPVIRGTDDGIWRRFLLVDFPVSIPEDERDPTLPARLREELPGVLRWAVEGALAWQREGLNPPATVLAATDAYREDSDVIGTFLDDRCEVGDGLSVTKDALYGAYEVWCSNAGLKPMSKIAFGRKVKERGFTDARVGKAKVHVWNGIDVPTKQSVSGRHLHSVKDGA